MESSIWKHAAKFLRDKKRSRRWLMAFACLAVVVAGGTVAVLKYNGQAMTYTQKVLECGFQVHKHTESCYTTVDGQRTLICGQADYVVHTHNDDCYDAGGKLVCPLPEVEEHKHDSSCYKTQSVPVCGQEESAGHAHDDSCYTAQRGALTCEVPEHTHTDACYDETGTLICGLVEHIHTDDCYAVDQTLTCGLEEGAGAHTHTDACYQTEKVLDCGKLENHTHTDACRDENGKLICGKLELKEHVHNAECIKTVELTAEEVAALSASKKDEDSAGESENIFFTDLDGENEDSALESGLEDSTVEDESKLDETTEPEYQWLSASGDDYTVTVAFPEDSLPENAELNVREIAKDTAEYESYYAQMVETLLKQSEAETEDELELKEPRFFDIAFMVDGEEVEPTQPVVVNISYQDGNRWTEETYGIAVHFAENGDTERIPTSTGADGYTFVGNSFSVYGIVDALAGASTYANGTAGYFQVIYDSNAADDSVAGMPSTQTVSNASYSATSRVTLPTAAPTRYGYQFKGWSVNRDGSGTLYQPGGQYTHRYSSRSSSGYWYTYYYDDLTFYAVWEKAHTVTLYTRHGEGDPEPAGQFSASEGAYLKEALSKAVLEDGVYAADCTWYNADGDVLDPGEALTADTDVYVVYHTVTLNLTKMEDSKTVRVYDGRTPQEDDFDYFYSYTYTTEDGENLLPKTLVDGTVTVKRDIVASSDEDKKTEITYYMVAPNNVTATSLPTIYGQSTLTEMAGVNYEIKSPDMDRFYVDGNFSNNHGKLLYKFKGWATKRDGEAMSEEEIHALLKNGAKVELYSVWESFNKKQTVNFYVNTTVLVEGREHGDSSSNKESWTKAIGVAQLTTDMSYTANKQIIFMGANKGTSAELYDYDKTVRQLADKQAHNGVSNNQGNTFQLDYFPDDAAALQALCDQSSDPVYTNISEPGTNQKIAKADLTPENYTIYWIVFKSPDGTYDPSSSQDSADAFHIDGVLVAKRGKLVVTKTFSGASEKVDKDGYSINVKEVAEKNPVSLELKIMPDDSWTNENLAPTAAGISKFTRDGNTYTWELELPQLVQYTVTENGYGSSDKDVVWNGRYQVKNRPDGTAADLVDYDTGKGIEVKVTNYPIGTPVSGIQTVEIENNYVTSDSILLVKRDDSGELLAGVKFQLIKDDKIVTLYKQNANHYYIYDPNNQGTPAEPVDFLETTKDGVSIHGLNEEFFRGVYVMREGSTDGYETLEEIKFTINEDGTISAGSDANTSWSGDDDHRAYNLNVKNVSERAEFTVTKEWDSGTTQQKVTVRLCREGAPLEGAEYTVELNEKNDWTYSWDNIPAYIGGKKAMYTIRETRIGDTLLEASPNYYATYSEVKEIQETNGSDTVYKYAQTVTNHLNTGEVRFKKTDAQTGQPLEGAVFTLTEVDEKGELVKEGKTYEATSGADGQVTFKALPGTYILQEKTAPDGFQCSDAVYNVTVTSSNGQNKVSIKDSTGKDVGEIKNDVISVSLPESGGPGTTLYTFGGIALLAICLVYGCSLRRRREGGAK